MFDFSLFDWFNVKVTYCYNWKLNEIKNDAETTKVDKERIWKITKKAKTFFLARWKLKSITSTITRNEEKDFNQISTPHTQTRRKVEYNRHAWFIQ